MIFNIPFKVINVANKLQVSLSKGTKVGQRIKRESRNEYTKDGDGNYLITPHPEHDFLIKSNSNYFLLSGTIKIRYEWIDGDKFKDEHKGIFKNLLETQYEEQNQEMKADYKHGDNYMENTVSQTYRSPVWSNSFLPYEPDCSISEVTIMEDNTVILCPMQHVTGWTFDNIDIRPGGSIVSTKPGEDTYIVFGDNCSISGANIDKHSTKKQVSQELEINNNSENVCTLIRIYK